MAEHRIIKPLLLCVHRNVYKGKLDLSLNVFSSYFNSSAKLITFIYQPNIL